MIVHFTYVIRTQFTYEHSGEWEEMTEVFAHMIRTQVTWVCLVSKVMWKDLKHCWDLRVSVGAEVFLKAFLEAKGTFSEKAIKQKIQRREKWIFFFKKQSQIVLVSVFKTTAPILSKSRKERWSSLPNFYWLVDKSTLSAIILKPMKISKQVGEYWSPGNQGKVLPEDPVDHTLCNGSPLSLATVVV